MTVHGCNIYSIPKNMIAPQHTIKHTSTSSSIIHARFNFHDVPTNNARRIVDDTKSVHAALSVQNKQMAIHNKCRPIDHKHGTLSTCMS